MDQYESGELTGYVRKRGYEAVQPVDSMVVSNDPADAAVYEMRAAINALPATERAAQHIKFLAVFDERPADLFISRMELDPARTTYTIKSATLYPSQGFLDMIAAVRAGKLGWEVE